MTVSLEKSPFGLGIYKDLVFRVFIESLWHGVARPYLDPSAIKLVQQIS